MEADVTTKATQRIDFLAIKRDITIDAVLPYYGGVILRPVASGRAGACPVCGGSKSSRAFRVSKDGRAWFCFGACQRGGSVLDLVMHLEHCDLTTAAKLLTERFGVAGRP
jgi:DNA primase